MHDAPARRMDRCARWCARLCALLASTFAGAVAADVPAYDVDPAAPLQSLGAAVRLIDDPDSHLSIEDVAAGVHDGEAHASKRTPPALGYPRDGTWVRLRLHNPSDAALPRLLVLHRGAKYLQDILIAGAGVPRRVQIGVGAPQRDGDVRSRHAVVALTLPPHATVDVAIRYFTHASAVLDYRLMTAEELAAAEWRDQWLLGALAGFGLAICAYVGLAGLATREATYLWFTAAVSCAIAYATWFEGLLALMPGMGSETFARTLACLFGSGGVAAFAWFTRSFIDAASSVPRIDRWLMRPLIVAAILDVPATWLWAWPWGGIGAAIALVLTLVIGASVSLAWWRGRLPVRTFGVATLLFLLVSVAYSLQLLGVLPDSTAVHGLRIALLGVTLVSFALAVSERTRRTQQQLQEATERNHAQLELQVQHRTAELSESKRNAEDALRTLQATQRELVAAEKMASLGQLVAGVAHEINTPLGVALTASTFLNDRSRDLAAAAGGGTLRRSELGAYVDQAVESARLIESNLERAARLVDSFKQVSVDRSSDDRRRFELGPYLHALVDSLQPAWKRRPLQMRIECPDGLVLDSYPGALGQVVTNCIQNALLHAFDADASGTMRVSARALDAGTIELCFDDDGCGIDPSHIAHIFDPFWTTRRNQGGTGLGLHIAYNLVTQKLGGQIGVTSERGAGTRFRIVLPVAAP